MLAAFQRTRTVEYDKVVSIHFRIKPTVKRPYQIYVIYDYGVHLIRMLKSRGVPVIPHAIRPMTKEEAEYESRVLRYHYDGYYTWQQLIEDEQNVTRDEAWSGQWISGLEDFAKCDHLKTLYEIPGTGARTKKGQYKMIL